MCAIVDANVCGEVFGENRNQASRYFLEWLTNGSGRLVLGGKLKAELRHRGLDEWLREALRAGRVFEQPPARVDQETLAILRNRQCRCDDPHVLALARISGARLLYTNDYTLQEDFTDPRLLPGQAQGRIYTTVTGRRQPRDQEGGRLRPTHRTLLRRGDLCPRAAP